MAVNLSALAPITTAATTLSNLVLVSPQSVIGYQPQNANGSVSTKEPGLLFHYEGEQTVGLESDITDHYVEDNLAIQDQWALKPETITTHGFIGELNDIAPTALAPLKEAANRLTVISAYTPGLSTTALIAYTEAFLLYQVTANAANSLVSTWNSIGKIGDESNLGGESVVGDEGLKPQPNQNKQQVMFQQFYGYWINRRLFTVQTPWAVFQNMAIKSLRAIQDAETRMISDFEITFKRIRFANTVTTSGLAPILQGRASNQNSTLKDQGTSTPPDSISLADGLGEMGAQ